MRLVNQRGQSVSKAPVQFRAEADAASTAGSQVTVNVYPPLQATAGKSQNINNSIVAGMQCTVLPNHRCGLLTVNDPIFIGMPQLQSMTPFPSANKVDPDTGVSIRMYYGNKFGENEYGMVHDCLYDATLVDEAAMMIAFPE